MSLSNQNRRILFLSVLGTALEFYDFTLFSVFAIQIGQTFFPASDPLISTLSALAAFAAGFIMRPIGGLVLGSLGDRIGRKEALSLSIFLMSLAPFVVGFLPSYEQIGLLAPVTILVLRLLQGFSAGGEFNGAAVYVLENLPDKNKAFYSSFVSSAGGLGALFALLLGIVLSLDFMPSYSFRFAFILGSSIALLAFKMRQTLPEENLYKESKKQAPVLENLKTLFNSYKKSLLLVFFVGALDGTLSYSLVGFLGVYTTQFLGVNLTQSFGISFASLSLYLILTPSLAKLYDRFGKEKFYNLYFFSSLFLIPLAFKLMQTKALVSILIGQGIMAFLLAGFSGTQHAFVQKLFPKNLRYTGIALSYNLGTCLLGGTAPMILAYLLIQTKNLDMPIYYILLLTGLVSLCSLVFKKLEYKRALEV